MSASGHWFDPKEAKQLVGAVDHLRARTSAVYDQLVKQDWSQIEAQLNTLTEGNQALAAATRQQLQEIAGLMGRFKRQTASALLELEQETKQIHDAMAQAAKRQTDLQKRQLDIEKSKLQLELWKVILGAVAVFMTGLLFPIVLWLMGVKP